MWLRFVTNNLMCKYFKKKIYFNHNLVLKNKMRLTDTKETSSSSYV